MAEYSCPECHSGKVSVGYPNIICLSCGHSEPLIDYPISWDWHRHYCRGYGLPDPGTCELTEAAKPAERLEPAPTQYRPNGFQQIQGELRHLENALNEHIDFAKKKKAVKKTGYKGLAT